MCRRVCVPSSFYYLLLTNFYAAFSSPWLQPFPNIIVASFRFYQIFFLCHPFFLFLLFYILEFQTQCVSTMLSTPLIPVSVVGMVARLGVWISSVVVIIVTVYAAHITWAIMICLLSKSGVEFLGKKSSLCMRKKYLVVL